MDIFTPICLFSSLSPSLWETARYRLKFCLKIWLVGCFGFNGPLRRYFSLYRAASQREGQRGEKLAESKNVQTTPTRTYCKRNRPLPYYHPNCRTPRHWKFTQNLRTTRPPPFVSKTVKPKQPTNHRYKHTQVGYVGLVSQHSFLLYEGSLRLRGYLTRDATTTGCHTKNFPLLCCEKIRKSVLITSSSGICLANHRTAGIS